MIRPAQLNRRQMLLGTLAAATATNIVAAPQPRLLIDTHLEVWTLDPKFPFNHPEAGRNLKVEMAAPIENQVEQMRDFGLKYAVLINPRYFGWDNSYIAHSLKSYPKLFVAHGLLNPEDPKVADNLRYWVKERGFQGMRFSPIYHPKSTWLNSKEHYPLWRSGEVGGRVQLLHCASSNADARRHGRPLSRREDHRRPRWQARLEFARLLAGVPQDVRVEKVSPSLDQQLRALRDVGTQTLSLRGHVAILQGDL